MGDLKTDFELLDQAATAADIEIHGWATADGDLLYAIIGEDQDDAWNPLADDGDALRLAVKLRMNVDILDEGSAAQIVNEHFGSEEPSNGDNYAATRRAIVRAAASTSTKEK
jgi:hypothetical protein